MADPEGTTERGTPLVDLPPPQAPDREVSRTKTADDPAADQTVWGHFRSQPLWVQIIIAWMLPLMLPVEWVANGTGGLPRWRRALMVAAAATAGVVGSMALYMNAQGAAHEVIFASVDDPVLVEQIETACPTAPVDLRGTTTEGVARENAALQDFVQVLQGLDPDRVAEDEPVADWIEDWRQLLQVRVEYQERLETNPGADPLPIPTVEGYSIAVRMSAMGGVECEPFSWLLDDFDISGARTSRGG